MNKRRYLLRPEGTQGNAKVQTFREDCIGIIFKQLVDSPFGILGVCQFGRNMNFPISEVFVQCFDPFGNSGFAGVDLLASADKADDGGPVFPLVKGPDQESSF